jgi:hypothetical protein
MKHELDDVLKHYGIKGMKWGVKRSDEEIAAANAEGGAGGGGEPEEDEDFLDKVDDVLDAFGEKMSDIGESLKKKGSDLLKSIFGEAKKTSTTTTFINGQDTRELKAKQQKRKLTKGSYEWYEERLKKETPKQTRDRLKKEWDDKPNRKGGNNWF